MIPTTINDAIIKGLAAITRDQLTDGGFASLSAAMPHNFHQATTYRTVFVPALILGALAANLQTQRPEICQPLASFLLTQKNARWSFNYWAKDTPQRAAHPYPDDLDDTFIALAGLQTYDAGLVDPAAWAAITELLVQAETKPGGPYRTWLVPHDSPDVWRDVDLAVNCNVAHFLRLADISLPNLTDYFDEAVQKGALASAYYPSSYPLLYYLTRAYHGNESGAIKRLLDRQQPRTPLECALLLSSYVRLGNVQPAVLARLAKELIVCQAEDGGWPAEAFCLDPTQNDQIHYNGCAALTTAFAVEALAAYQTYLRRRRTRPLSPPARQPNHPVLELALQQSRNLGADLRYEVRRILRQLGTSGDGQEIMALAHAVGQSLHTSPTQPGLHNQLGLASLYGWAAYTIYDDFLDDEGQPGQLSAANVCMRRSLQTFRQALPDNRAFMELVDRTFDTIDGANSWEVAHCRCQVQDGHINIKALPDYGSLQKLYERSLGHTLAPVATLLAGGQPLNDPSCQQLLACLRHYLIARQLNDDLHDWADDLKRGQLTYVVCQLLNDARIPSGSHQLTTLLPKLQRRFWRHSLPALCRTMQEQISLSRQALRQVTALPAMNPLASLLDGTEASVAQTLRSQNQAAAFLKRYEAT